MPLLIDLGDGTIFTKSYGGGYWGINPAGVNLYPYMINPYQNETDGVSEIYRVCLHSLLLK
jgi:hypothetical protein